MQTSPRIPCYIITGFLGTGKTTAIGHLLKHRPEQERWAVLINEFGEIGLDGAFLQHSQPGKDVFIREIPGGCMCCTSGLPVQIALNQLLARARPQRLLIEPSGLGHPAEILALLRGEYYRDILYPARVITLLDARKISSPRYLDHPTFQQQLDVADSIVANKCELYTPEDFTRLEDYLERSGHGHKTLMFTTQGAIPAAALMNTAPAPDSLPHSSLQNDIEQIDQADLLQAGTYRAYQRAGKGLITLGWRFAHDIRFDRTRLLGFLGGLEIPRAKGLIRTSEGACFFNQVEGVLSEHPTTAPDESRVEFISEGFEPEWLDNLLRCCLNPPERAEA